MVTGKVTAGLTLARAHNELNLTSIGRTGEVSWSAWRVRACAVLQLPVKALGADLRSLQSLHRRLRSAAVRTPLKDVGTKKNTAVPCETAV